MDFHHRDPAIKDFAVMNRVTRALETLIAEAAKCDLLCARCHRIRHAHDPLPPRRRRSVAP